MLGAAMGVVGVRMHVAVVTSDRHLLDLARAVGTLAMAREEFPRGLNAALRIATSALVSAGATEVATVLSDVPLVTAEDMAASFYNSPPIRVWCWCPRTA